MILIDIYQPTTKPLHLNVAFYGQIFTEIKYINLPLKAIILNIF